MKDERPISYDINAVHPFFRINYLFTEKFINKSTKILDSGCGTGYGTVHLAKFTDNTVIGVDYEEQVIDQNKKMYTQGNLQFLHTNGKTILLPNNSVDLITSFHVIEHIEDYTNYLNELKRILKPEGTLIICTPNKEYFSPGLKNPVILSHKKEFYPDEFYEILSKHFDKIEIFGKFLTVSGLEKFNKYSAMNKGRLRLIRFLSKFNIIKKIGKLIPLEKRAKFTAGSQKNQEPNTLDDYSMELSTIDKFNNKISTDITIVATKKIK